MSLKYSLSSLGWYNFENLVQTLLKVIIGPGVTSFGGTKDKGRDAAFRGTASFPSRDTRWEGEWIFQAKYSDIETPDIARQGQRVRRAFRAEIRTIRRRRRAWPDNYILMTNVQLSAASRDNLREEIVGAGYQGNFCCIDGREVCQFLDQYPQIRRSFPQLIGLADIDRIVNKHLYSRSESFVSDLHSRLTTFVATIHYMKAIDVLRKHNFVVLDGPPEAGKSFIGGAISLAYLCDGFEVFFIQKPEEVFRAYESSSNQLYFADDAVGSIRFDPSLGDYWSRELPRILSRLNKQHKLVWTTRHYILREALERTKITEHIENFPTGKEVLVEVGDLSLLEKALILYNHAKAHELSSTAKQLLRKHARRIAGHPNFTPERVRQLVNVILQDTDGTFKDSDEHHWIERIIAFSTTRVNGSVKYIMKPWGRPKEQCWLHC